ncbi:MAG TPA: energy transducer TonB [Kofleriaceae bacterium]|nr:energy transducer TonB [Kofleriaceae bacterium]
MRWDSPFVLATAGTLAIHLIVVTAGDAMVVTHPPRARIPAPHVELVDIEPPPVLTPPPPPVAPTPPPPDPTPEVKPAPRPQAVRAPPQIRNVPTSSPEPPARAEPPVPSGGDEVVRMDDIAPAATGVSVAVGKRSTGHVGRGGTGGGTGAGSGTGGGDEVAKPVSVATIKTRALPKGDYAYVDVGKDYPPEARALGIEGAIRVRLVVDEHGKVTSRVLLNRLGHGLDELALKRAAEMEFEPARDSDDHPVASVVVWTFTMTLPK